MKRLLFLFLALLLAVSLAGAVPAAAYAEEASYTLLVNTIAQYLQAQENAAALLLSACDSVQAFLDAPSYQTLLASRICCDEGARSAPADVVPATFHDFSDSDILFLARQGIPMDELEIITKGQRGLAVETVTTLIHFRSYLYDKVYYEADWPRLQALMNNDREFTCIQAQEALRVAVRLLAPIQAEPAAAQLMLDIPTLYPVITGIVETAGSLDAAADPVAADLNALQESNAGMSNLVGLSQHDINQLQLDRDLDEPNRRKSPCHFEDMPKLLPLPRDWLFLEPDFPDNVGCLSLEEKVEILNRDMVFSDDALYDENGHVKKLYKIDFNAALEQVDEYVVLLMEYDAKYEKFEESNQCLSWYLTFNDSLIVVSWDADGTAILYDPWKVSFEEIYYINALTE